MLKDEPKAEIESFTLSATADGAASQGLQRWIRKYSTCAKELASTDPAAANSRILKHEEVVSELLVWHETLGTAWAQPSAPSKSMASDAAALMLAGVRAQVHALQNITVPDKPTGSAEAIDQGEFRTAVVDALRHPFVLRP